VFTLSADSMGASYRPMISIEDRHFENNNNNKRFEPRVDGGARTWLTDVCEKVVVQCRLKVVTDWQSRTSAGNELLMARAAT